MFCKGFALQINYCRPVRMVFPAVHSPNTKTAPPPAFLAPLCQSVSFMQITYVCILSKCVLHLQRQTATAKTNAFMHMYASMCVCMCVVCVCIFVWVILVVALCGCASANNDRQHKQTRTSDSEWRLWPQGQPQQRRSESQDAGHAHKRPYAPIHTHILILSQDQGEELALNLARHLFPHFARNSRRALRSTACTLKKTRNLAS